MIYKWAIQNRCAWTAKTFSTAVGHGDTRLLRWLREAGCPWDKTAWEAASKLADPQRVQDCLIELGCPGSRLVREDEEDKESREKEVKEV